MTRNRNAILGSLILGLVALPLLAGPAGGQEETTPEPGTDEFAKYVMGRIDDQYRGERSHGTMRMKVHTKHWDREMKMEAWALGEDYSLVRILEPKKEKGSATLKAKNDLFTYLSKTGKTIKITSGMMGGSWMGSHFTNDDLVQHTRLSDDYEIEQTFAGTASGVDLYRFRLTPKPDAPVVWGKIVVSVRQSDLQPLRQLFYDEDGKKVRVLKFYQHKNVQGRVIPKKMVMKPLDGSGEYTVVQWKKIDFDVKLQKSFFTLQKLKSL